MRYLLAFVTIPLFIRFIVVLPASIDPANPIDFAGHLIDALYQLLGNLPAERPTDDPPAGVLAGAGILLTTSVREQAAVGEPNALVVVQSVARGDSVSVLDMNLVPGNGAPPHVHRQFAETFTVLSGELLIGRGRERLTLGAGESATIPVGTAHFFQNKTNQLCRARVTINPGSRAFEEAMLINYGLTADGFADQTGTLNRLSDGALILNLTDATLAGLLGLLQPVMNRLARLAIHRGRLNELRARYVAARPPIQ